MKQARQPAPNTFMTETTGTIDITATVDNLKSTFVTWAVAYIYGLEIAVPGLEWVATPIISQLDQAALKAILNMLVGSVVMEAFFLNTAIRKASQAQDYVDAITAKNALPPTATQTEYAHAEAAEILAFRNFVTLGN